jgi:hypothetical protein
VYSLPWRTLFFRMREHIMGESVRATKVEMITAEASVTPNSLKSRPVVPVRKASGTNTATSATEVATTAKPISFIPSKDACSRSSPPSIRR